MRVSAEDRLTILRAVAAKRCTATSAGFHLDGMVVQGHVKEVLDVLWLEDLIDADLAAMDEPQLLALTDAGETVLAHAGRKAKR